MNNSVRVLMALAVAWLSSQGAIAQVISTPDVGAHDDPARKDALRVAAETAKKTALSQLRKIGGRAARTAATLQDLQAHQFLERLAVQPVVGPSTIAAPVSGQKLPIPSVNWSVGGGPTTGHPGVALLLARSAGDADYAPRCTGTLVRQNVILTAAHCICWSRHQDENYSKGEQCSIGDAGKPPAPLSNPQNWRVFFQHVGMRDVAQVIIAEQYQFDENSVRNDLALLVLTEPVRDITPAELPTAANPASPWTEGEVIGFGFSATGVEGASILAQLTQPGLKSRGDVLSSKCDKQNYLDPAGSLCSMYGPNLGASTTSVCSGDSGGPLRLFDSFGTAIGVTSGRNNDNCTSSGTVSFQMAISYSAHRRWIEQHLNPVAIATVPGRWPTFGENLRDVVQRRNVVPFAADGSYLSEGWMANPKGVKVLATINSSGPIDRFEVQNRQGSALCSGQAGMSNHIRNVDFCSATIPGGTQYRIVAAGRPSEFLQYVVTAQPTQ